MDGLVVAMAVDDAVAAYVEEPPVIGNLETRTRVQRQNERVFRGRIGV